jgi:hypothetical protein
MRFLPLSDAPRAPHAMTPDLTAAPNTDASPARRRLALAALLGLAAAAGSAQAQMGPGGGGGGPGGGGPGGGGPGGGGSKPDKKDDHARNAEPRDLVAAFARRLREGAPDVAITPAQATLWRDFVGSMTEVGQHNERRLQRILFHSASRFSAASPLRSYLDGEVDEGESRQQALAELKVAYDKLDAALDERQRAALANLFVVVRGEVQAPPGGDR